MIRTRSLSAGYGGRPVVQALDLRFPRGEVATIIGPNGSGKSTLLRVLSRVLRPMGGVAYLDGKRIHRMPGRSLARVLAALPQCPAAPADFTVRDLAELGRYPHRDWAGRRDGRDDRAVAWALEVTGMAPLQERRLGTLSGGERQRAWIAMALAQEPQVMLLDEPTTFLDICHQLQVLELIRRLCREAGLTIVMVLHDLNHAARYSDSLVVLRGGRVYRVGPPGSVITPQTLRDVFRIEAAVRLDPEHGCPYFLPIRGLDGERP